MEVKRLVFITYVILADINKVEILQCFIEIGQFYVRRIKIFFTVN